MEEASHTTDERQRKKLLTTVIGGGGPTGVEISGMLAEMKKNVLPKDYPEISGRGYESHIYLIDALDKVLAPMSKKSQSDTFNALTKLGVEIKFGLQVKDYVNDVVS